MSYIDINAMFGGNSELDLMDEIRVYNLPADFACESLVEIFRARVLAEEPDFPPSVWFAAEGPEATTELQLIFKSQVEYDPVSDALMESLDEVLSDKGDEIEYMLEKRNDKNFYPALAFYNEMKRKPGL